MKKKIVQVRKVCTTSDTRQFCVTCGRITAHLVTRVPGKLDTWRCKQCGQLHKYSIGVY